MLDLLIVLVLGHLVTDFILQSDETCKAKCDPVIGGRLIAHFKHMGVYFAVNLALIAVTGNFSLPVLIALVPLALAHGILDFSKSYLSVHIPSVTLLLIDQAVHMGTILISVALLFPGTFRVVMLTLTEELLLNQSISQYLSIMQKAGIVLILLIFVTSGANVLIRAILTALNIKMSFRADGADSAKEDSVRTGRYIGAVERILTVVAMLAGSYEGIIALYASKTAIRFKHASGNPQFEEYYILGTLISLLIGITSGIMLKAIL